jgi:recombination protein RecA
MGIKKITGIPEIDVIANALKKKFGDKPIVSMGPKKSLSSVTVIPTGSIYLDCTLGAGGFPDNRIIEIFGPPSAGKTSMALQLMKKYVDERGYDRPPLFIDLERTTSLELVKSMGINPDKVLFAYPDTAEEALEIAKDLGNSGKVGFIVFDSIDAAQAEADVQRDIGAKGVGELARLLSKSMRLLSKVADNNNVCYIFINQIRMKIGVMYGNPETTSGGNALPFYASLRLRVSSKPSSTAAGALAMKIKVVKNKLAPGLNQTAEFEFICGKGINPYNDLISYAKDIGIIRFAGSAVKLNLPEEEEVTMCTGGKNGATSHVIQNPEAYTSIRNACYAFAGIDVPENPNTETQT